MYMCTWKMWSGDVCEWWSGRGREVEWWRGSAHVRSGVVAEWRVEWHSGVEEGHVKYCVVKVEGGVVVVSAEW